MQKILSVEQFFDFHSRWREELFILFGLLEDTGMEVAIKWHSPVFMLNKRNVVGLWAYKYHVGIWFPQGALLDDKAEKLVSAKDGNRSGLRQWKFSDLNSITQDIELINSYIHQAMENEKKGLRVKRQPIKKELIIPEELQIALKQNPMLSEQFLKLSFSCKREYAEYIRQAKKEETRRNRLNRSIPLILEGKGLMDKYRS